MNDNYKGLKFSFYGAFCYALMLAFVKLNKSVPNEMLVFFRNLVCLISIFPLIMKKEFSFQTQRFGLHSLRSLIGVGGIYCFFYSAKHLLLVDALLLFNTVPLFIPLIVFVWRKERISFHRIFILGLGFLGIIFILKPQFTFSAFASFVGILGGICTAFSHVCIRELSKTEKKEVIVVYFFTGLTFFSFFPMIYAWEPILDVYSWLFIALAAIFALLFQLLIVKAYAYTSPAKVSSMLYFTVMWGALLGWVVWKQTLDIWTIAGCLLIVASGLYSLFEKKKLSLG